MTSTDPLPLPAEAVWVPIGIAERFIFLGHKAGVEMIFVTYDGKATRWDLSPEVAGRLAEALKIAGKYTGEAP